MRQRLFHEFQFRHLNLREVRLFGALGYSSGHLWSDTCTKTQSASSDETRSALVYRYSVYPGVVRLSEDRSPCRIYGVLIVASRLQKEARAVKNLLYAKELSRHAIRLERLYRRFALDLVKSSIS